MSQAASDQFNAKLGFGARLSWLVGCAPELIKNVAWDVFVLFITRRSWA